MARRGRSRGLASRRDPARSEVRLPVGGPHTSESGPENGIVCDDVKGLSKMEQGVPPSMSTTVGPHVGRASNESVCKGGSRAESLDNCDSQKVSGGDEVEVGVVEDVLVLHPIADHAKLLKAV